MAKERTVEGRIGSAVDPILYRKLHEIARMFGRTKSDLLKEAIWEIIQQRKTKQEEVDDGQSRVCETND